MHTHFRLDQTPFEHLGEDAHYYLNSVFDDALTALVDGIASDVLVLLLTGEPGTGKTALLRRLRARLQTSASVVCLPRKSLEWAEFLHALYAVAAPPGEATSSADKAEALRSYLVEQRKTLRTVLLIDDAQHSDPAFIENLTALAGSHPTSGNLLQIVLAGTPELEDHLRQVGLYDKLDPAAIVCRNLRPLRPTEVEALIQHELEGCGHRGEAVFSPDALDAVAYYSCGLPRRVQMICGAAMRVAYEKDMPRVDAGIVEGLVGKLDHPRSSSTGASRKPEHLWQNLRGLASDSSTGLGLRPVGRWVKQRSEELRQTLANDEYLLPDSPRPHAPKRDRYLKTQIGLAISVGCLTLVIWLIVLGVKSSQPVTSYDIAMVNEDAVASTPDSGPVVVGGVASEASDSIAQPENPKDDQIASLHAQYSELKSLLEQAVLSQQDTQQKYQRLSDDYTMLRARADRLDKQLVGDDASIELAGVKSTNEKERVGKQRPPPVAPESVRELDDMQLSDTADPHTQVDQPRNPDAGATQGDEAGLQGVDLPAPPDIATTQPLDESLDGEAARARGDEVMGLPDTRPAPPGNGMVIPDAGPTTDFSSRFTGETVELAPAATEFETGLSPTHWAPPTLLDPSSTHEPPAARDGDDRQTEPASAGEALLGDDNATLEGVERELAAVAAAETPLAKPVQGRAEGRLPAAQAPDDPTAEPRRETPLPNASQAADLAGAVEGQRDATVVDLLARGAPPNAHTSTGDTVLMSAAANGNVEIVGALLSSGASPDQRNAFAETALMKASWHGRDAVAARLLDAGAELEALNADGWSALFYAAINGHVQTVHTLLRRGARVNVQSHDGRSALAAAVWNGHTEVAETLLASGADANQRDADGWTPLMAAAWSGDTLIIRVLIEHGADDSHKSKSGQTALLVAKTQGHVAAVELLNKP